jgi:ribose transport system permease protein
MARIISMARLPSGVPTAFGGVELRMIAACVIGGASVSGGEGTVAGALLGLIFMALVTNGLTLFGVSISLQVEADMVKLLKGRRRFHIVKLENQPGGN